MSWTLRSAIDDSQTTVDIVGSGDLPSGSVLSVDSEYVEIRTATLATLDYQQAPYYRASINRGHQGTTRTTHAAGATLTRVTPGATATVSYVASSTDPTEEPPALGGPWVWDGSAWRQIVTTTG
jgi:hypothetical protein